ncbi:MAG: hypothetical protein M3280_05320 [Actinomycetota bacterium]|nr:hypothetical protein [Actinomycetota bacterium]
MRSARALAGLLFLGASAASWRVKATRPLSIIGTWFGVSHLVAGATGFSGCPEKGAIPSLILRRDVYTGCGPWERIDRYLAA